MQEYQNGLYFSDAIEMYTHEVFEAAIEASTLTTKERNELPDKSYALIVKDDDGKLKRRYPMVGTNMDQTLELQRKAVAYFGYCAADYKEELAKGIVRNIKATNSGVMISPKSQIHKYTKVPANMVGTEFKFPKSK